DVYLVLHRLDSALVYADLALVVDEKAIDLPHPQRAYTYLTLARIHLASGDWTNAQAAVRRSLLANNPDFSVPSNVAGYLKYDYFFEALLLKAEILRARTTSPRLDSTPIYYEAASTLLFEVQQDLTSQQDRITLADYSRRLASAAIDYAHDKWASTRDAKYVSLALKFVERAKANVLRTAIIGKQARRSAGIPDTLRRREDELTATIGYHKRRLSSGVDSISRMHHQRELFKLTQARKDLLAVYAKDYPLYRALKRQIQSPQLTDLCSSLHPDELLYVYSTGEHDIYRFELSQGGVDLSRTPKPKRLEREVTALVKGITRRLDRLYLRKASTFFELLLPRRDRLVGKKLILVPDGPLLKIPFEALLTERTADVPNGNFSTLSYLLNNGPVSYAPSASLFYQSRLPPTNSIPAAAPQELLAFAPVFGNGQFSATTQRNIGENTLLSALPATRTELESLQAVFRERDRSATTLIGPAATEASLYASRLESARYLHFATHGFVNEEYPDLSGLALYPDTTSAEDNFLSVGEVYNLKLNAELVTLSACETGLGKVASGEGVLGFTRAFLYAGADNLLVSLWQVQDEATAGLMVDFYRRILATNGEFSSQLRAAKLGMIAAGKYSHPYYWSAFVLIGE
ncbi:MAG: CHAT domain-containing tetratricopeptide repeat protein, partial [Bacteroidota bacterium]